MDQNPLSETVRRQIEEVFLKLEKNRAQIPLRVREILERLGNSGYDYFQRQRPSLRDEIEAWTIALIVETYAPREEIKNVLLGVVLATIYERTKEEGSG